MCTWPESQKVSCVCVCVCVRACVRACARARVCVHASVHDICFTIYVLHARFEKVLCVCVSGWGEVQLFSFFN